jgi:hypothetical protein
LFYADYTARRARKKVDSRSTFVYNVNKRISGAPDEPPGARLGERRAQLCWNSVFPFAESL